MLIDRHIGLTLDSGSHVKDHEQSAMAVENETEHQMRLCQQRGAPSQLMLQARLSTPEPMTAVTMCA